MREEFDASQEVKRNARIIVVIGNPPYDRFAGAAQAEEAGLVAHYKGIELVDDVDTKTKQVKRDQFGNPKTKQREQSALYLEYGVRKQLLDDLYIRFFRMAEERIGEAAEFGVVSFISNSSYLTRASFFGETQVIDFARVSRRSRVRYWVRSGLIPSRAKALVWSGVGRA